MGSLRSQSFRVLATCGMLVATVALAVGGLAVDSTLAGADSPSLTEEAGGPGAGSVSCTGPTNCTAVFDATVQTLQNGVWLPEQTFDDISFSGPAAGGGSSQISCSDALDCTAVGRSNSDQPAVIVETNGTWGTVQTLSVSGDSGNELTSVSCSDALDCTAVGSANFPAPDLSGDVPQPVAATETNGVWGTLTQIAPPSEVALDNTSYWTSVSCTSIGNCIAVGYGTAYYLDNFFHPLGAAETNGVWGNYQVGATDINGAPAVSCPDATHCTAVSGDTSDDAIAFSAGGGSLGAPAVIGSGLLMGVDCLDANNCVAVNNSRGSDLYMVESDGNWTPEPVVEQPEWLSSVSCASTSDCTAIGALSTSVITNTPSVAVTDNAATVGHSLTFTATVSGTDAPAPTGAVSWTLGGPGVSSCSSTTGPVSVGNVATYTCTLVGAGSGTYSATANFGGDANYAAASGSDNSVPYTAVPSISSFSPASGRPGTKVTIKGANLEGATKVTFNGVKGTINTDDATKIKVSVPTGAKTGKIKLVTPNGKAKTATLFMVT
jgi:hypothetical protein